MIFRIAFCGLAGSGKSTAAFILRDKFENTSRLSFAGQLKADGANALGALDEQYFPSEPATQHARNHYSLMQDPATKARYRDFLQWYGEYRRQYYGNDFWLIPIETKIKELGSRNLVIDDLRHFNEADLCAKHNFTIVLIERPGAGLQGSQAQHITEINSVRLPYTHKIINDGDMEKFRDSVLQLVWGVTSGV